jgi:hypothetical protein
MSVPAVGGVGRRLARGKGEHRRWRWRREDGVIVPASLQLVVVLARHHEWVGRVHTASRRKRVSVQPAKRVSYIKCGMIFFIPDAIK